MSCNDIGDEGAIAIALTLLKNNTLKNIDLSSNKIGNEGAKLISKALEINKTITNINLKDNNIVIEGAKYISKALEINKTITNFKLSYNKFGKEGVKSIAKALETNKTITYIGLSVNYIGDEGTKAIISMMENNYTLLFNDFVSNDNSIYKYLERNKLLQWKIAHKTIVDICIAMSVLELPNYVMLEIVDWFPFWEVGINRYKKISLIENINRSIRKLLENRETHKK